MARVIRPRDTKTIDFYGVGFDDVEGIVEGIAGVTGNVDDTGERVLTGAFTKSIADHRGNFSRVPMGIDHEVGVGLTQDMQEVGRSDLPREVQRQYPDATGGLYCKGQVVLSDTNITLLKRMNQRMSGGKPVHMSFTYSTITSAKATEPGVVDLAEVAVHEWGPAWRKRPANSAARLTSVKALGNTDVDAKGLAGSYEDLGESIMDAVRSAGLVPAGGYGYVVGAFPGYAVVNVAAADQPSITLRIDWSEMSGQIVLGAVSEVEIEQVVVPAVAKAMEVGALMEVVDRYAVGFKAGRMFSQANLDELDAALKSLQKLWDRATTVRTEDTGGTGNLPTGDAPAAKAVEAADDPTMDLQALQWDLAILETRAAAAAIGG